MRRDEKGEDKKKVNDDGDVEMLKTTPSGQGSWRSW